MIKEIWIKVNALTSIAKSKINDFAVYIKTKLWQSTEVKIDTKKGVSELKKLEDAIADINWDIRTNKAETVRLNRELRNFSKNSQANAKDIINTRNQLDKYNSELTEHNKRLKDARRASADLKKSWLGNFFRDISNNLALTIKRIAAFTLAFAAIRGFKSIFNDSIQNSLDFESALAWVNKTLDLTATELLGLDNELINLSKTIPLTYVELAKIAELWGQLDVGKDDIIEFTEVMADLRATTNITTEEWILKFAKFNNVMWITWDEIRKMADVIVDLGNNSATTESQILTFATRIASSWKIAWVSAQDIFAIGTAFSSAWIEAEAGWTAVQKVLLDMSKSVRKGGDQLDKYAEVSGLTSEEFARQWEESAWTAFAKFVTWLKNSGKEAWDVMEDLDQDNVRTVRAFLATAQAWKSLEDHIKRATKAYDENTASQIEAAKRYETNKSKLIEQRNEWRALGREIWDILVPILISLQRLLLDIVGWLIDWIRAVADFYEEWKLLSSAITAVIATLIGYKTAIVTARVATVVFATTIKLAAASLVWLRAAITLALWPIWLLVAWITAIVYAWREAKIAQDLYNQSAANTASIQKSVNTSIDNSISNLKKLEAQNEELLESKEKWAERLLKLNNSEIAIEKQKLKTLWLINSKADSAAIKSEQEKLNFLRDSHKELVWETIKWNAAILTDTDKTNDDIEWWAWDLTDELKELREKELEEIKKDNEKRASIIDKYNKEIEISTETTSKETSERVVRLNQDALDERLRNLKNFSWEELEVEEKQIKKLDAIIKKHTKNIEEHSKDQADFAEDYWKALVDWIKEAQDEIDKLDKQIKELRDIWVDKDQKLAERRVEILEEQKELKLEIAKIDKDALKLAEQLSEETLTWVWEWTLLDWVSWFDLLEIKDQLKEQEDLQKELDENIVLWNEWVFEQVSAYEALNESAKINADAKKDEKELLEELWWEYDNLEDALINLSEKRDIATKQHQALMETQILWEQYYWESVATEFTGIEIIRDAEIAQLDKIIARLKERNVLMGNAALNTVYTPDIPTTTTTIVNNTDNSNTVINESENAKTTSKNLSTSTVLADRGSTPSNNS